MNKFAKAIFIPAILLAGLSLSSCGLNPKCTDLTHQITIKYILRKTHARYIDIRPLIISRLPYQEVISLEVRPKTYSILSDKYGNQYLKFNHDSRRVGETWEVSIKYRVKMRFVNFNFGRDTGQHVPGDIGLFLSAQEKAQGRAPEIQRLTRKLTLGKVSTLEKVSVLNRWVNENITYVRGLADQSALSVLQTRKGQCSGQANLLVALCYAAGIPARRVTGLVCTSQFPGGIWGENLHAWVEVYLPGKGWAAADPALMDYFGLGLVDHVVESMTTESLGETSGVIIQGKYSMSSRVLKEEEVSCTRPPDPVDFNLSGNATRKTRGRGAVR